MEERSSGQSWHGSFSVEDDGTVVAKATKDEIGEGVRPRRLLEASFATCMNISVRMVAEREGIDFDAVTTRVELDRSSDPETIRFSMAFEGPDESEAERLRNAATDQSRVYGTLTDGVRFEDVSKTDAL